MRDGTWGKLTARKLPDFSMKVSAPWLYATRGAPSEHDLTFAAYIFTFIYSACVSIQNISSVLDHLQCLNYIAIIKCKVI